jgi:hypothetical protein
MSVQELLLHQLKAKALNQCNDELELLNLSLERGLSFDDDMVSKISYINLSNLKRLVKSSLQDPGSNLFISTLSALLARNQT